MEGDSVTSTSQSNSLSDGNSSGHNSSSSSLAAPHSAASSPAANGDTASFLGGTNSTGNSSNSDLPRTQPPHDDLVSVGYVRAGGAGGSASERIYPHSSVRHFRGTAGSGTQSGSTSRNSNDTTSDVTSSGAASLNGQTPTTTSSQTNLSLFERFIPGTAISSDLLASTNLTTDPSCVDSPRTDTTYGSEASVGAEEDSDGEWWGRKARREPKPVVFPMTVRFKYEGGEGGEGIIVTGRDDTFQHCDDEPIHCPGAIQAYGVLIAFDEDESGNLVVAHVSENSGTILGISPKTLFDTSCITKLFSSFEADILRDALEMLDEQDPEVNTGARAPHAFEMSGRSTPSLLHPAGRPWSAYCALHRPDASRPKRVIIELELLDDFVDATSDVIPPTPQHDGTSNIDQRGGMMSDEAIVPTEYDLLESTVSAVQPLKEMVRLRRRRERDLRKAMERERIAAEEEGILGGRGGSPSVVKKPTIQRDDVVARKSDLHIVQLLGQVEDQMERATNLEMFYKITAGVFKELTEFDRAMIYEFDEKWNGQVVAEQADYTKTKDLYRGLHFPATDIPAQARELYRINKVRLLYDRDQPTARICCRSMEELENPLDMSHCFLRAMSPIHLVYLRNMGVRATMSISIVVFGKLWGLVALHHYGNEGHRVAFPIRSLCRLLSDSIGRNIERLTMAQRLELRKVINVAPSPENPGGYIVATAEDLLALFKADFGCLSIGDEAKILGDVTNSQELLTVLEYLREKRFGTIKSTTDITKDYPDIDYPSGFKDIAGFLIVPLSRKGRDFILFCRRGQLEHIRWAGNPYKDSNGADRSKSLDPRRSFKAYSESVVGKCRSWAEEQQDTPQVLLLIYGKFIDVWRSKESLLSATRLANLLLVDASKAVRTPLNSVIGYLEIAMDGVLDPETLENVQTSYAASRTLVHVINDLLDLTRIEEGNDLFLRDPFDLPATIAEGIAVHKREALRRGLTMEVVESPQGTPTTLLGDPAKIQRIISNVAANAVHATETGGILVEWGESVDHDVEDAREKKDSIRIGISITDTGCGIPDARLELMFREFEHMSTISEGASGPVQPPVVVGLGLALTSRIVRNLGGQLRVESKVGRGSKFTFILPFRVPSSKSPQLMAPPRSNIRGTQTEIAADLAVHTAPPSVSHIPRVNHNRSSSAERHHTASSASSVSELSNIMGALGSSHMDQNSTAYSTRITDPNLLPRRLDSNQVYSISTPLLLDKI